MDRTDEAGLRQYFMARDRLNELLLHEEVYWKQRAKTFWLAEGDENTKFFHATASARRKTNRITHLDTDDGMRVEKQDDMCKVVFEYFSKVFTGSQSIGMSQNLEDEGHVTAEQNRRLVADVSFAEFTLASKQMHSDKASGPDRLNLAFF